MPRRGSSKPPAEPVVKPYGCDFDTFHHAAEQGRGHCGSCHRQSAIHVLAGIYGLPAAGGGCFYSGQPVSRTGESESACPVFAVCCDVWHKRATSGSGLLQQSAETG